MKDENDFLMFYIITIKKHEGLESEERRAEQRRAEERQVGAREGMRNERKVKGRERDGRAGGEADL